MMHFPSSLLCKLTQLYRMLLNAINAQAPPIHKPTSRTKAKSKPNLNPQTLNNALATLGIYFDWGPAPKPRGYLQSGDE